MQGIGMKQRYTWDFPLPRTHTGMLQGNGLLGAMIWGGDRVLKITLGRADLWDHRGGLPWTEKMSYGRIRACLDAKDEAGLRELFEHPPNRPGEPSRPSIIPIGHLELDLGAGAELRSGELNLADGTIHVKVAKGGRILSLRIQLDMRLPIVAVTIPQGLGDIRPKRVPVWKVLGEYLRSISFNPPSMLNRKTISGWVQDLPVDPSVCVGYRRKSQDLLIAVTRGPDAKSARTEAKALLEDSTALKITESNGKWWQKYWQSVPQAHLPNDRLSFLYYYGMYKFAGLTQPDGVPATLQGTWIEDYQMPPWSSDYHFNINVQMCYQPAFHGNKLSHLLPLFEMVLSWDEPLKHNAKMFLRIDDGAMLPHAVDDRCVCMGGFWSGTVDHGCTAWVALMMYRYYRYSMDEAFLRRAYPFMVSAMRVYEEMLEEADGRMVLPVSVSPEYRGAQMDAWGTNASFQLACIHALCEALTDASQILGEKSSPVWAEICRKLPKACLVGEEGHETIALWEGVELEESHRHHSHLAGITPFDVIDVDAPQWHRIVSRSLARWIHRGPGLWSGWCIPWASAIHTRVGNAVAAELYLDLFDRIFTNEGHGTLHNASASGISLMGRSTIDGPPPENEIMQMDGGMGAVAAIQEMLLHTRRGVTHLFAGAPARWKDVSFRGMLTDGAFLLGAARKRGRVVRVDIASLAGGTLQLANPWQGSAWLSRKGRKRTRVHGKVLKIRMAKGEKAILEPN